MNVFGMKLVIDAVQLSVQIWVRAFVRESFERIENASADEWVECKRGISEHCDDDWELLGWWLDLCDVLIVELRE